MPASESTSTSPVVPEKKVVLSSKSNPTTTTGTTSTTSSSTTNASSSKKLLSPPKAASSFGIMSGENVRSLSPAEQARTSHIYHSHERAEICLYDFFLCLCFIYT